MLTITKQMTYKYTRKTINSNKQKQWNNKVILEIYKNTIFLVKSCDIDSGHMSGKNRISLLQCKYISIIMMLAFGHCTTPFTICIQYSDILF